MPNVDDHDLEEVLHYKFINIQLLKTALTHSSYREDPKSDIIHNERLEFLGDSVLSICITQYLYCNFPELDEGKLSKIRAGVVSETSLSQVAREMQLGKYMWIGKGVETSGKGDLNSILADALEALIGALFLDGGLNIAETFVLVRLVPHIQDAISGKRFRDHKTELQELIRKSTEDAVCYTITNEKGPPHNRVFSASVSVGTRTLGAGSGESKKEAEQQAAYNALLLVRGKS